MSKILILNQVPTDKDGNLIRVQFGNQADKKSGILMNYGGKVYSALMNAVYPDDLTGEKAKAAEAFADAVKAHLVAGAEELTALMTTAKTTKDAAIEELKAKYADIKSADANKAMREAIDKLEWEFFLASVAKQSEMTSTITVEDEQFDFINSLYVSEPVKVRLPFLAMVEKLNPAAAK